LRTTGGNFDAAASFLLGDQDVLVEDEQPNQFLNQILNNPTIQAGLSNPRVFAALKAMLENPSIAHQNISEPEIGPIMMQVYNIIQNS